MSSLRAAVLGANGLVGSALLARLGRSGAEIEAVGLHRTDLEQALSGNVEQLRRLLGGYDLVYNCIGFSGVDLAEQQRERAWFANAVIPNRVAAAMERGSGRLVQLSSDYVFDGQITGPYPTDAEPNPLQYYGETKLWGERSVLHPELKTPMVAVVRAAWVFGATGPAHSDFPNAIAGKLLSASSAEVTKLGLGAPTSVNDLAEYLLRLGVAPDHEFAGIHHAVASGATSWFDFAQAIARDLGFGAAAIRERVPNPAEGAEVLIARRPANSVLEQTSVSGYQIDHWSAGWQRYLPTLRTRLGLPDLAH